MAAEPSTGLPGKGEIDLILRQLADITGFRIHRRLPFAMVTRDQVNAFLKQQIQHSVKPADIRAEEATLKKFGFVPPAFDLRQTTIDLLTEQAAAYYDFRRKKLFISDWASRNMRDEALVHELAHALADQNFPIRRFLAAPGDNSEASIARDSVVEGQASWLMIEYAVRRMGRTLGDPETARELLREQMDAEDAAYPVFSKAPLYLRTTLMFPYEEGRKFQQVLFARDGKASFAAMFQRPPSSTAQVLHPEKYFADERPKTPELPRPAEGTKGLVSGSMGELDHRILLRQFIGKETSESLAPQLKGASYRIDEGKKDHRLTLIYISEWNSEDAARRYFAAYRQVLIHKWKTLEIAADLPSALAGKGDDGYFRVSLDGALVTSQEGFSAPFGVN